MTDLDYGQFEALTFDCYGTLIDWEAGILAGLRRVLAGRGATPPDDELLEAFARVEARLESGPYLRYREILGRCLREVAAEYAVAPVVAEVAAFADSVGDWPAFPDSIAALERLEFRYRLGVITNCDDDLFARSAARLETEFDWVVTAQSAGELQAGPAQLRGRVRADRAAARTHPPRRAEPLPRPRAGQGARPDDGLDRSPRRPARVGRDTAGRREAGRDLPGHGVVRRGGDCHLTAPRRVAPPPGPRPARTAATKCGRSVAQPPLLRSRQDSPFGAERLPAAVLDLDEGGGVVAPDEPDLDLGRVGAIAADVPQVDEPIRRLPGQDLAPFVLDAGGRSFVDPATGPRFEHDRGVRLTRHGVVGRPPRGDPRRPDVEGVVGRAVDLEREADRLDHRSGRVFSATSRKRTAASPHTRSR